MSSAIDRPPLVDISTIAAAPPIAPVKPSQHAQDRNASSHPDDTFGNLPVQLDNTLSPDETLRNGAISMLKRLETCHGFCCALLSVLRSPTAQLPRRPWCARSLAVGDVVLAEKVSALLRLPYEVGDLGGDVRGVG